MTLLFHCFFKSAIKKVAACAYSTLVLSVFITFFVSLAACSDKKLEFKGVDITGADYAQNFKLEDQFGKTRTIADFKGKAVVIFFGFTQCPDVCPTAMADLAEVKKLLGKDGEKMQGIFISLDPERDTAPVLKAYMENFDPTFIALRGSLEQTAEVAKHFKIFYKKVEGRTASDKTQNQRGDDSSRPEELRAVPRTERHQGLQGCPHGRT